MSSKKSSERINELAKKLKEGTITHEEKEEFDRWYDSAGVAKAWDEAGAPGEVWPGKAGSGEVGGGEGGLGEVEDALSIDQVRERIFQAIADRTGLQEGLRPGAGVRRIGEMGVSGELGSVVSMSRRIGGLRRRRVWALPAAAVLMLVLAGGWWYYRSHGQAVMVASLGYQPYIAGPALLRQL